MQEGKGNGMIKKAEKEKRGLSLSLIFTLLVVAIVLLTSIITILVFTQIYRKGVERNAVTSSEQSVVQVQNMVESYTRDMEEVLGTIRTSFQLQGTDPGEFIQDLVEIREDVVAVTTYNEQGELMECWSSGETMKSDCYQNLSDVKVPDDGKMHISKPHVATLFKQYYPWVVTISQIIQDADDQKIKVAMDIRFSNIANYVDDVGIGAHGYCYIEDTDGNIVYHPQQQLIYSGLKKESTRGDDGVEYGEEAIYTTRTLSESKWRIVGVCYVDEMVTNKVEDMVLLLILILVIVLIGTLFVGILISNIFAKPVKKLTQAMRSFEKNAENYTYQQVGGTEEIVELSKSFEHMVVRIQKLMEKVRQEEITLRKTELKALQAQINPHFLYNTLDAIAWLCEDGRSQDAEDMVTSLAKLFRISISKGHELITIEKEIQHAESYLKIQKFRYKNQFTYRFDVDEECLSYLCNKITLQPIIENAIYHGINRMVDEGEILIEVHQDQNDIILAVEDNGVGMTEEQCQEIMRKERGDRTGIGIKNVNDRIKIYFGEEYGLSITSELDEGTRVTIRMPKVTERESDGK